MILVYDATILADSISPKGHRLVTFMATFPRMVLSEMNTHRVFSRNSASTRAIPIVKQVRNVLETPFIPEKFGVNKPGMQHSSILEGKSHETAKEVWLNSRDRAVTSCLELVLGPDLMSRTFRYQPNIEYVSGHMLYRRLDELDKLIPKSWEEGLDSSLGILNVHKQIAGRLLEPFMWHVAIISSTEFDNFFALRDHPEAQGEISKIARLMRLEMEKSEPIPVSEGGWHTPLVRPEEFDSQIDAIKLSVARTAAVSYRRHDQVYDVTMSKEDYEALVQREIDRYDKLLKSGHLSPFEHQATPFTEDDWNYHEHLIDESRFYSSMDPIDSLHASQVEGSLEFLGNFRGWIQHRKSIHNDDNFAKVI